MTLPLASSTSTTIPLFTGTSNLCVTFFHFFKLFLSNILPQSNILIDEHGRACLTDFGLSQIKETYSLLQPIGSAKEEKLEKPKGSMPKRDSKAKSKTPRYGTLRYMAPEQMSQSVVTNLTDIYSFGMTMYEVCLESLPVTLTGS